uniref:Uncharacterized protein n=1 Tax=Plectus sambesii TaxID=2011161 RepID=A0A914XI65_9BILA
MADQSSDSATASLRLATKTIIEEFCASPSATATLVLRLKKGTVDVSSLDPISRLALTVLRQLFDELEKAVRNCAQQSESNTTDIGGRVLNCLRHDEDANQKETLDRLARQFLNRKNMGADKIRGLQSNDSEEKNIKFLRTASKSPAEILNFMSENDSSIEYAPPKLPGQLPTLPLEQLSDSEQSSTPSGSSK